MPKQKLIILPILIFLNLFTPIDTSAQSVSVEFTGIVTSIDGQASLIGPSITVGSLITGSYSYETATLDIDGDPNIGNYPQSFSHQLTIRIENREFATDDGFDIVIRNDLIALDTIADEYLVAAGNWADDSSWSWSLETSVLDNSATLYNNDTLPDSTPDITHEYDTDIIIFYDDHSQGVTESLVIYGAISTIQASNESSDGDEDDKDRSGGCFIAFSSSGTSSKHNVQILRSYRDEFLAGTKAGDYIIYLYYKYSPPVAEYIQRHDNVRYLIRLCLIPLVAFSWLSLKIGMFPAIVFLALPFVVVVGVGSRKHR